MLKYKGKSKGIIWKNITYDWSKQYMIIDKGLNKYFGLLSIYANGKQVQIRIYSILYKGRYYIFKIQ